MASGIEFKAVGKGLDDLAKSIRDNARSAPDAFAYASSGLIQLAGAVLRDKYIVAGSYVEHGKNGRLTYTEPPGGTHGPYYRSHGDRAYSMHKIFVKGKFVDRTGGLLGFAHDVAGSIPSEVHPRTIGHEQSAGRGRGGEIVAGINRDGSGYIIMKDGYRAAEVGSRQDKTDRLQEGKRGVWRSLRTVRGRFATLLKKKYPDLFKVPR